MRAIGAVLLLVAGLVLAGCGSSKFLTYNGPEVTQVFVSKTNRKVYLLHHDTVLKSYNMDLGFAPVGHKTRKGDGKTPEGYYWINKRNPNSAFHLSVGISYPNRKDVENAKAMGFEPGGDIFIHGQPLKEKAKGRDWTAGCIAVQDKEIEEIYAMVRDGTPIYIAP